LDRETCIQILDEGGFLRKRGYMSVNLGLVPDGLSAEETKRFILENGAKICPAGAWGPGAPGKEIRSWHSVPTVTKRTQR
jgi:hypothetical protein